MAYHRWVLGHQQAQWWPNLASTYIYAGAALKELMEELQGHYHKGNSARWFTKEIEISNINILVSLINSFVCTGVVFDESYQFEDNCAVSG